VRRFARLLIIVAIVVAGVGFYRGWFVLSSGRHSGSNKVDVNLSVDPDKVKRTPRRRPRGSSRNFAAIGSVLKGALLC